MQYTTLIVELFKKILIAGDLDVSNTLRVSEHTTKTLVVIAQTAGPTGATLRLYDYNKAFWRESLAIGAIWIINLFIALIFASSFIIRSFIT